VQLQRREHEALDRDVVPSTSSAAIKVRQAKAHPIFKPERMLLSAAGTRILAPWTGPRTP